MKYQKLSRYAKNNGLSYMTAFRHHKQGLIPNVKILPTGTILVGCDDENVKHDGIRVVLYARVSAYSMKENLERQIERLSDYAVCRGFTIVQTIKEIASGMNDKRPKLLNLLKEDTYDCIVVEHRDRLTRFGFNYIETFLNKNNKKIIVVNESSNTDEHLMEDLVSIIYSFTARLYGQRKSRKNSKKIVQLLQGVDK